ncbi:MAG: Zn-dependent hydrolase, partial [Gemmatimonadota bacterium]|nr:Zn-dependent hydrolase [Gemmatimonadota bacterium]
MNRREFTTELTGLLAGALGARAIVFVSPAFRQQDQLCAQPRLRVNGPRLNESLNALAEFGKTPQGGVTRLAYSEADQAAREYVMGLMAAAKLEVRIDAGGNIIGRRAGREAALPPILFGSHIDSVPDGGRYDGNVGSMGAIEVARTLADNNVVTRHPLEVVIFQNEEGGLIGSRAMIGALTERELDLVSRSGKTIREGIAFIGGDPNRLAEARRKPGEIAAYLELHIEQGAVLATEKIDIGVVEGIVGINWWDVTVQGFANHAGTTPMDRRRDALLATAKFIEAVNRVVTSVPGRQVGTVGRIQALPGAPNVIPGTVVLSLELRDLDAAKIAMLYERIRAEARRIGDASGTTFD